MNREAEPIRPALADPSPDAVAARQGRLFAWLRRRTFRNSSAEWFGGSRLKLITMALSSVLVCAFVFGVAWFAFDQLVSRKIPGAGNIVGVLFDLMFFALSGMLVFSVGLILYASLFTSTEARFLLCSPARADQIFGSKYRSALAFASWGFVVLTSPILLAHGLVFGAPWYFYLLLPAFFLGFVVLPGAAGGVLALLVVNFLPRSRAAALGLLIALLALAGAAWAVQAYFALKNVPQRDALQSLVDQFALTSHWAMPSHWMAAGVLNLSRGEWGNGLFRLALIWSHGLFAYLLAAWAAARLYRRGFNRVSTGGVGRQRHGTVFIDRLMAATVSWLDPQTRKLILKDFVTFRRDPSQWAQLLIFAGLLGLYVTNSRRFYQNDFGRSFANWIALLNLSAMGMLMCAYLGRFVYPMLSLEGRKFWILGLLPLSRERLMWGKFLFAFVGSVLFAWMLVIMSDVMLNVAWEAIALHLLVVLCLALGLSGLAVGVGACLPNFRETDPSKIVTGFGGTVNMVISLGYLVVLVAVMGLPYHLSESIRATAGAEAGRHWWAFAGLPVGLALCALATIVPMRAGAKNLRGMEF